MKALFVDTAEWMACADAADPAHEGSCAARDGALEQGIALVTTDYVVDEEGVRSGRLDFSPAARIGFSRPAPDPSANCWPVKLRISNPAAGESPESATYQHRQFDLGEVHILKPAHSSNQPRLADSSYVAQVDGAGLSQAIGFTRNHLYKRGQTFDPAGDGRDDGRVGIAVSEIILQHKCGPRFAYLRAFDRIEANTPDFTAKDCLHRRARPGASCPRGLSPPPAADQRPLPDSL